MGNRASALPPRDGAQPPRGAAPPPTRDAALALARRAPIVAPPDFAAVALGGVPPPFSDAATTPPPLSDDDPVETPQLHVRRLQEAAARPEVWTAFLARIGAQAYARRDTDPAMYDALRAALVASLENDSSTYFNLLNVTTPPPPSADALLADTDRPLGDPVRCADAVGDAKALCESFTEARGLRLSTDGAVTTALHRLLLASTCRAILGSGVYGTAFKVCASPCIDCTVVKVVGQSPFVSPKSGTVEAVYNEIAKYAAVQERLYKPRLTPHLVPFLGYAVETATRDGAAAPSSALGALFMGRVMPWVAWDGSLASTLADVAAVVQSSKTSARVRAALVEARVDWAAWWRAVFSQVAWTALAFRVGLGNGKHNDMHRDNVMFTEWPSTAPSPWYVLQRGAHRRVAPLDPHGAPMVCAIDYGLVQGTVLDNADAADVDSAGFDVYRFAMDAVYWTLSQMAAAALPPEARGFVTEGVKAVAFAVTGTADVRDVARFDRATNALRLAFRLRKVMVRNFLAQRGWPSLAACVEAHLPFYNERDVHGAPDVHGEPDAAATYTIQLGVTSPPTAAELAARRADEAAARRADEATARRADEATALST